MKKILLVSILILVCAINLWATQTQLFTDSFGGTFTNTLTTYSAAWKVATDSYDNCTIAVTAGVAGGSALGIICSDYNDSQTWTANQWGELKVDGSTVADARWFVCVNLAKVTAMVNGYCGGAWPDTYDTKYRLFRLDQDVWTPIGSASSVSMTVNDVVNIENNAGAITLVVTGTGATTVGPVTDNTYTTGNPGLVLKHSTGARLAGTFRAGSITSGGTLVSQSGLLTGLGH